MKNKKILIICFVLIWVALTLNIINYARKPKKAPISAPVQKEQNISPKEPISTPALDKSGKTGIKISSSGVASWYDYKLDGQIWSREHDTCASRDLKRYTIAKVLNLENGKTVECFVNDYIEYPDRDIDLSSHAFEQLAPLSAGLINVVIIGEFKK